LLQTRASGAIPRVLDHASTNSFSRASECRGALEILYDVALLVSFRHIKPPEERASAAIAALK
jgi:hypothetical protein